MDILISFCNTKNIVELEANNISPLGLLNTSTGQLNWVKLPHTIDFNSITGLTQNSSHIFAAFSGNQTGIFTISKTNSTQITINILKNIKDPHSIAIKDNFLYIVSSGTDTVFKHKILSNGSISQSSTKFWKPTKSKGNHDTHHLNSILFSNSKLLISGFGPKSGNSWSSARKGYIYNLTDKKYIQKNIYHPHTIFSIKNNNYICQSSTSSILQNGKKYLQFDSGYVRGLIQTKNQVCVGISSGRKTSKSTGITNNPADIGSLITNCKIVYGNHQKYNYFDFSTFHNEIYDLLETDLLTQTNLTTLNKFSSNFNSITQTINTSSQITSGWQTHSPNFEFLNTHPQLQESTGWAGHKHFAYDIVANIKPKIIVELGTYYGFSLFSMTQAIKDFHLDTNIYGIDTWKGDKHAGTINNSVYKLVKEIIKIHYSSQKIKLIKALFSSALTYFNKNSIDLLHIDGLHTYQAVKQDFDSWLPKMSKNGIVMFHDISVTKHDFGVKLLWEEIKNNYKHIDFFHSHGLGILFLDTFPQFDINTILNSYYSTTGEKTNHETQTLIIEKQKIIDSLQILQTEQQKNINHLQSLNLEKQKITNTLKQSLDKIQSSKTYMIWQKFNQIKRKITGKKEN